MVANGQVIVSGSSGFTDKGSHITFENGHVWDLSSRSQEAPTDPGNDYGAIQFIQQAHVAVLNSEIGPVCCSSDGINEGVVDPYPARDYTISGNYIHDLYDSCTAIPAAITALYGPCTGLGGGDVNGASIDGMQLWGGISGLTITRNRIYSVGDTGNSTGQGIYIERDPTSLPNVTFANILIANNMVNMGAVSTNAISLVPNGGTLGATGYLKILYNTIWASGSSQYGNIRIYNGFMAPGTTVVVAGNIAKNYDTEDNSCAATAEDGWKPPSSTATTCSETGGAPRATSWGRRRLSVSRKRHGTCTSQARRRRSVQESRPTVHVSTSTAHPVRSERAVISAPTRPLYYRASGEVEPELSAPGADFYRAFGMLNR